MAETDFYQQSADKQSDVTEKLKKIEAEIKQTYTRWDKLESKLSE